ncbi:hypothetical protein QTJ16_001074 [Diplocarpon rosae]|uniref:Uncharacterized protein n=1 Tax=Diplocarpon rosae TaxID=946125 RepID=A0AAD9T7H8_9HELO|nr:hypothetical protein QTJ16_001074 [Diplocarpon rosae]
MAPNNADDPWKWSTDRLVQELCTSDRSWSPSPDLISPNPVLLEKALRSQKVTGKVFLNVVDNQAVRNDLGVSNMNQRMFVLSAVFEFRDRSNTWNHRDAVSNLSSSLRALVQRFPQHRPAPPITPPSQTFLIDAHFEAASPSIHTSAENLNVGHDPDFELSAAKRRKLGNANASDDLPPHFEGAVSAPNCGNVDAGAPVDASGMQCEDQRHQVPPMKLKKRLDLAALTTEPLETLPDGTNIHRHIPTEADPVSHLLGEAVSGIEFMLNAELDQGFESYAEQRPEQVGEGPKKLVPDFVTADTEGYRDQKAAAYEKNLAHIGLENQRSQLEEEGALFTDPNNESEHFHHDNSLPATPSPEDHTQASNDVIKYTQINKKSQNHHARGRLAAYLGKSKLPVDEIFYQGIKFGQDIDVDDLTPDDLECSNHVGKYRPAPGCAMYVNTLMKNFFLSKHNLNRGSRPTTVNLKIDKQGKIVTQNLNRLSKISRPTMPRFRDDLLAADLKRDEEVFTAIRTYHEGGRERPGLIGLLQTPSFTLFYSKPSGEVRARREKVIDWPELLVGKDLSDYQAETVFEMISNKPELDPDSLLTRYRESKDEVGLPIFGESDEDYDDPAFWREYEREQGIILPKIRSESTKTRTVIAPEEVDAAIDEAIAKLVVQFEHNKLPRLLKTAWRIWRESRKHDAKEEHIAACQARVDHLQDRLRKQREEIHILSWFKYQEVLAKAYVMEYTVLDREYELWKISILEQDVCPEKPSKVSKVNSGMATNSTGRAPNVAEYDLIDYESDGMGEFVVNDAEEERDRAVVSDTDSEDDSAAVVDVGNSYCTAPPYTIESTAIPSENMQSEEGQSDSDDAAPESAATPINSDDSGQEPVAQEESSSDDIEHPIAITSKFRTPRKSATRSNNSASLTGIIDLTADSPPTIKTVIDLDTPEKPSPKYKVRHRSPNPYVVSSSSDTEHLPPYENPAAIAEYPYTAWENQGDRERLLIRALYQLAESDQSSILEFFSSFSISTLWALVKTNVNTHLTNDEQSAGYFTRITTLVQLYMMFIECKHIPFDAPLSDSSLEAALLSKKKWFSRFYNLGCRMHDYLRDSRSAQLEKGSPKTRGSKTNKRSLMDSDDDGDEEPTKRRCIRDPSSPTDDEVQDDSPHIKRKKAVIEDASARDLRERNKQRLAEQEERRQVLKAKLEKCGGAFDKGKAKYIINDAAESDQGYIYVNKEMSPHIKPHQMDGVRFMWNQIVTLGDEDSMQGCLLAHTMGLGKTMQTICLLVAIAEAASSPKPSISSQIPECLKKTRALVLSPAGLIDNWMDEFLTWTQKDVLGNIWKVNASLKKHERLETISEWDKEGGVLLISYDSFRNLINNEQTKARLAPLNNVEHERVQHQLLQSPNIVIADEAHKMKNMKSKLTKATTKFRTKSRIALTGSPLANNVEEYYSMINFIVENYLGSAEEFRSKYKEPIEAGLFLESTALERRRSLKTLGLLNSELELKVHRRGMQVLKNELPPKVEFVLSLPLTDIQHKAYSMYIDSLKARSDQLTKDGDVKTTTLWSWIATLSLLCNHPYCFNSKIHDTEADKSRARNSVGAGKLVVDDIVNVPLAQTKLSKSFIQDVTKLFNTEDLLSIKLSHKISVLCQILDAAKNAGDKTLVFSSSIPTLDFLERLFKGQGRVFKRLDGNTPMAKRQGDIKSFNRGQDDVYLISTMAGGLGLNLQSSNRVIIFDFKFNPTQEEQAVGRAYRIGQDKPTFVYRFVCGGTFEDNIHNKTIFKAQLASRVVDKKSPLACATKNFGDFLYQPKEVPQKDLSKFKGMDPEVLDKILASPTCVIRSIVQTDTFEVDDEDRLTESEMRELELLIAEQKRKRKQGLSGEAPPQAPVQTQAIARELPRIYNAAIARVDRAPIRPLSRPRYEMDASGGFGSSGGFQLSRDSSCAETRTVSRET